MVVSYPSVTVSVTVSDAIFWPLQASSTFVVHRHACIKFFKNQSILMSILVGGLFLFLGTMCFMNNLQRLLWGHSSLASFWPACPFSSLCSLCSKGSWSLLFWDLIITIAAREFNCMWQCLLSVPVHTGQITANVPAHSLGYCQKKRIPLGSSMECDQYLQSGSQTQLLY